MYYSPQTKMLINHSVIICINIRDQEKANNSRNIIIFCIAFYTEKMEGNKFTQILSVKKNHHFVFLIMRKAFLDLFYFMHTIHLPPIL